MKFRIVTYNIHKGIGGLDRRYRLERIIETIAQYEPDIVLLQEVDDNVPRSHCDCQAELLANSLGMDHYLYQRNVHLKQGHYGNAILSRFPLTDAHHLDLTIRFKKRRRALVAHCSVGVDGHRRTMLLVNIHLGLAGFERQMQLRKILNFEMVRRTQRRTPLIIGGDYNDVWGNLGKRIMEPAGFELASGYYRTFPAAMPTRSLDRIFYRGDLHAPHAFASRSKIARHASDHLPLIVDFQLLHEAEKR